MAKRHRGGGGHRKTRSLGSPRHTERSGPGMVAGAGELFGNDTSSRAGPGKAAMRKASSSNDDFPSRSTPPGSAPRGMKTQYTDDE